MLCAGLEGKRAVVQCIFFEIIKEQVSKSVKTKAKPYALRTGKEGEARAKKRSLSLWTFSATKAFVKIIVEIRGNFQGDEIYVVQSTYLTIQLLSLFLKKSVFHQCKFLTLECEY